MSNENEINWQQIGAQLRAPFDPAEVDFRAQLGKNSVPGDKVQAVHYIDARTVADRLDEAVGPGAWSFTYEPLVIERGEVQLAKGALTIHGVTKEDIGDASTFSESKGCVSDALKRAAVLWGVGRYLYSLPSEWITLDQRKQIPAADVQRLRAKLPRPDGAQPVTLSELQEVVRHTPVRGGSNPPAPAQSSFAARPPVLHATVNTFVDESAAAAAPKSGAASDEQRERMRQQRNILHILDKTVERADNILNALQADERIKAYDQRIADRQREGARA